MSVASGNNQMKLQEDASRQAENRKNRILIMHYHIFKNAGTSVDAMLKKNFGTGWREQEFALPGGKGPHPFPFNSPQVAEYISQYPEMKALSSHTALLPLPEIPGIQIAPIVFIRHPLDRLRSAYLFERNQDAATFGAQLAKARDFRGYLLGLVRHTVNRSARSFQTHRLSMNEPDSAGTELQRAMRTLESFAFVGLVEAYDQSMARLEKWLAPHIEGFRAVSVHANVSQPDRIGLDGKLAAIRAELGEELFAEIWTANADDIALFEATAARYK